MAMVLVEHLRIVNSPLRMMVKGIMDVQLQIKMAPGVPQELIQRAIWRSGPDVTTIAKKIVVGQKFMFLILLEFSLHRFPLHKLLKYSM